MHDSLPRFEGIIIGITEGTSVGANLTTGTLTSSPSTARHGPMAERVESGATQRLCKAGHDISKLESRASNGSCRICKAKKDREFHKIYDKTPKGIYSQFKRNLRRRIKNRELKIKKLEEYINAEENRYRDGESAGN